MNNKLEQKLYHDLSPDLEVPSKVRTIIKESINNVEVKKKNYSIIRIALTTCATLILTVGIVYAGTKVYDTIWKKPEMIKGVVEKNTNKEDVINSILTEQEAKEKAKQILEKFGYENDVVESIALEENAQNYDFIWKIETKNNIHIDLDAKGGNYFAISYDEKELLSKDILKEKINKEEAETLARKICKEYGYNLEKYNKTYVIPYLEDTSFDWTKSENEIESYQWNVVFSKTYENGINSFENIRISFISGINKLYYFMYEDGNIEENPVIITAEDAKQIVLKAEQKVNFDYNIKDVYVNLDIAQMNGDAYLRLKDYDLYKKQYYGKIGKDFKYEDYTRYRTENLIRRTWMVTIESDEISKKGEPIDKYYTYHVDATTGEIIGGSPIYYLLKIQNS